MRHALCTLVACLLTLASCSSSSGPYIPYGARSAVSERGKTSSNLEKPFADSTNGIFVTGNAFTSTNLPVGTLLIRDDYAYVGNAKREYAPISLTSELKRDLATAGMAYIPDYVNRNAFIFAKKQGEWADDLVLIDLQTLPEGHTFQTQLEKIPNDEFPPYQRRLFGMGYECQSMPLYIGHTKELWLWNMPEQTGHGVHFGPALMSVCAKLHNERTRVTVACIKALPDPSGDWTPIRKELDNECRSIINAE